MVWAGGGSPRLFRSSRPPLRYNLDVSDEPKSPVEPEDWVTRLRRMLAHRHELEFCYLGMVVGIFEGPELPSAPCRYQYLADRGPGHYELACALNRGEHPRC